MKIQYISHGKENINEIECTTLANPKSFYIFDVNIINLNSQYIWRCNSQSTRNINCSFNFHHEFPFLYLSNISPKIQKGPSLLPAMKDLGSGGAEGWWRTILRLFGVLYS